MLKEFREFIMRGNVIDLAVAFVMGAAFGAVVNSLVKDIIMPVVGYVLGGVDFSNMFIVLGGGSYPTLAAAKAAGAATINYGVFINTIITFLVLFTSSITGYVFAKLDAGMPEITRPTSSDDAAASRSASSATSSPCGDDAGAGVMRSPGHIQHTASGLLMKRSAQPVAPARSPRCSPFQGGARAPAGSSRRRRRGRGRASPRSRHR